MVLSLSLLSWPSNYCGCCHCPASESVLLHITTLKEKSKVKFQLTVSAECHYFHSIVKSNIMNGSKSEIAVVLLLIYILEMHEGKIILDLKYN